MFKIFVYVIIYWYDVSMKTPTVKWFAFIIYSSGILFIRNQISKCSEGNWNQTVCIYTCTICDGKIGNVLCLAIVFFGKCMMAFMLCFLRFVFFI